MIVLGTMTLLLSRWEKIQHLLFLNGRGGIAVLLAVHVVMQAGDC